MGNVDDVGKRAAVNDPSFVTASIAIDFAFNIAKKMYEDGIKKKGLAKQLGVSSAYITKLLNGITNMTIETMVKVADAVGFNLIVKLEPKYSVKDLKNYESIRKSPHICGATSPALLFL